MFSLNRKRLGGGGGHVIVVFNILRVVPVISDRSQENGMKESGEV